MILKIAQSDTNAGMGTATSDTNPGRGPGLGLGWGQLRLTPVLAWGQDWDGAEIVMGTDGTDSNPRMGSGLGWGWNCDGDRWDCQQPQDGLGIGMGTGL